MHVTDDGAPLKREKPPARPVTKGTEAILYLDGRPAGAVVVQGWDASWTYGQFSPGDEFSAFAPIFGRWSLLMHEDEAEPLSAAAAEALREAERLMDRVRARIYFPTDDAWHDAAQINIDGNLIEWKEF